MRRNVFRDLFNEFMRGGQVDLPLIKLSLISKFGGGVI